MNNPRYVQSIRGQIDASTGMPVCSLRRQDLGSTAMKFNGMILLVAVFLAASYALAHAQSHETPLYDKDGRYSGSVFDYGRTQTYTDRSGQFNGSAVNNGNGTTLFFNRNGQFSGSAGSSIDRAFNFNKR
jgi:hypothetical protein